MESPDLTKLSPDELHVIRAALSSASIQDIIENMDPSVHIDPDIAPMEILNISVSLILDIRELLA